MKKRIFLICLGMIMVLAGTAMAGPKPIQLSLLPEVALFSRSTVIEGLALNIWGENPQKALALGVVNGSTGSSAGFSFGFLLNYADSYTGIQWAPVNYTKGSFLGWQNGVIDYAAGSVKGLQTGMVNYAGNLTGVQFGLVNYAARATTGVQIGLVNLIPSNAWFSRLPDELAPGMVFVNWRF